MGRGPIGGPGGPGMMPPIGGGRLPPGLPIGGGQGQMPPYTGGGLYTPPGEPMPPYAGGVPIGGPPQPAPPSNPPTLGAGVGQPPPYTGIRGQGQGQPNYGGAQMPPGLARLQQLQRFSPQPVRRGRR
jgi:hypothetical protein